MILDYKHGSLSVKKTHLDNLVPSFVSAFGGKNTFSLMLCLDSVQVSGTKVANMKSYLLS